VSRYLLSPAAQADLEEIWNYTASRWDVDQAEQYVRELQRAIERAAGNPQGGRACDEIRAGYRKLAAGSHTLYYRLGGVTADPANGRLDRMARARDALTPQWRAPRVPPSTDRWAPRLPDIRA
jgi:toxin ParE1/3/4